MDNDHQLVQLQTYNTRGELTENRFNIRSGSDMSGLFGQSFQVGLLPIITPTPEPVPDDQDNPSLKGTDLEIA